MNSRNPLLLPEILSNVLQYVDLSSLKTSRLVSSFWNVEAGRILSSSSWVKIYSDVQGKNTYMLMLARLQQTLDTSEDPGKFFRKLRVHANSKYHWFPKEKLHDLLKNYGQFLKALDYIYYHSKSAEDGSSYCQLLIFRVITKWCPHLEELSLGFSSKGVVMNITYPIPSLKFNAPINLRSISICISCEIPKKIQNLLVRVVEGCTDLKVLKMLRQDINHCMHDKLAALVPITKNLKEFMWSGVCKPNVRNPVQNNHIRNFPFQFSNKLQTLCISNAVLDLRNFPVIADKLNSIGPSLKKLELLDCVFNVDTLKDFQSDLFKIVIKSLVNLETLRIEYFQNGYDYFFSNADSLDALPHQNLRHLFLPFSSELQFRSVSTVVKWFPNLTRSNLLFGNKSGFYAVGCVKLAEVVWILAGLKRLEDLSLSIYTKLTTRDLQNTLRTLKQIPKLLCFTLEELGSGKTTYTRENNLRDRLKKVKHLNFIRRD